MPKSIIRHAQALELKPKWGYLPHWTLAHDHAMKVQWDLFLNYRVKDRPEIRPSFEAIATVCLNKQHANHQH